MIILRLCRRLLSMCKPRLSEKAIPLIYATEMERAKRESSPCLYKEEFLPVISDSFSRIQTMAFSTSLLFLCVSLLVASSFAGISPNSALWTKLVWRFSPTPTYLSLLSNPSLAEIEQLGLFMVQLWTWLWSVANQEPLSYSRSCRDSG